MMGYRDSPAERCEGHMTDLTLAAAIKGICESSFFRTQKGRAFERRIVKLCNEELQRQVALLDKARSELP